MSTTNQLSKAQQLAKDCEIEDVFERRCRAELIRLDAENKQLRAAVAKFHAAKGRYHTQLAVCDLFDLCNLPNERPKK